MLATYTRLTCGFLPWPHENAADVNAASPGWVTTLWPCFLPSRIENPSSVSSLTIALHRMSAPVDRNAIAA